MMFQCLMHINVLNSNCSGNNSANKLQEEFTIKENTIKQNSLLKHLVKTKKVKINIIHLKKYKVLYYIMLI